MSSLPASVKEVFSRRNQPISYDNQIAIVNADNQISSYQISAEDMLAEDWEYVI